MKRAAIKPPPRFGASKYNAKRTPCGYGHVHPSKAEALMCLRLHTLQLGKQITGLMYPGRRVALPCGFYTPDYTYFSLSDDCEISLEVKGFQDKAWRLRWREVELYADIRLEVWQLRGAGWRRILPPKAWAKQRTLLERGKAIPYCWYHSVSCAQMQCAHIKSRPVSGGP